MRLSRERRRRLTFRISIGVLGLVLATFCAGIVLSTQVSSVQSHLESSMGSVSQLRGELQAGDLESAGITVEAIQTKTSAARNITTGPLWQSATYIPAIGENFKAVAEVAVAADDLAVHAAGPLVSQIDSLDLKKLSPTDGRFDLSPLQKSSPHLLAAATAVHMSHQRMASLDLSRLIPQIAQPVRDATEQLEDFTKVLDTVSWVAELLPGLLGTDGPRDYLILVQNSAETRATGGIPGALAILHTEDGRIRLGEQSSAVELGVFNPMIDVDPEQISLFSGRLGTQMQNVNLTPDFPTAAQTAKQMWEERYPAQILDGVLAMDAVVLSHLLETTGPLELTDAQTLALIRDTDLPATLTQNNVLPTLLSNVYREIEDPEAQDAYFAAVAGRVFSAFADGQGDGAQMVKAIGSSTRENRLYLWSSDPAEQKLIASTPLHGSVVGSSSGGTAFGVYFNDGTGAKMDFYSTRSIQLINECSADEYGTYTVRITATNNAPSDASTALPRYVTGGGVFGVDPGKIRTNYVVYGPSQAFVENASLDGRPIPVSPGQHGSRPVGSVSLELAPGETKTLDVIFSKVVQDSDPDLTVTPTLQSLADVVVPFARNSCP